MKKIIVVPLMLLCSLLLVSCSHKSEDARSTAKKDWPTSEITPTLKLAQSVMTPSILHQLGNPNLVFDHGSFVVNNNSNDLDVSKEFELDAQTQLDVNGRPAIGKAVLTKTTRLNKKSDQNNEGEVPYGWSQKSNLKGYWTRAYDKGALIEEQLVGGFKKFDASPSNFSNVITQTAWANEAYEKDSKGQQYYENMIREAQDSGMRIRYQVKELYEGNNLVPSGTEIEAVDQEYSLKLHVFIPNVQPNIKIDYKTGNVIEVR